MSSETGGGIKVLELTGINNMYPIIEMAMLYMLPSSPPKFEIGFNYSKPKPIKVYKTIDTSSYENILRDTLFRKNQNTVVRSCIYDLLENWNEYSLCTIECNSLLSNAGTAVVVDYYNIPTSVSALHYRVHVAYDSEGNFMCEPQYIDLSRSSNMCNIFFPYSYKNNGRTIQFQTFPRNCEIWKRIRRAADDPDTPTGDIVMEETCTSKKEVLTHKKGEDIVTEVVFENNMFVQFDTKRQCIEDRWTAYGYKIATIDRIYVIVKLAFDSTCIISKTYETYGKCRANKALVLALARIQSSDDNIYLDFDENLTKAYSSYFNSDFSYPLGEWVEAENFDMDFSVECSGGLHFFFDLECALQYLNLGNSTKKIINLNEILDIKDVYYPKNDTTESVDTRVSSVEISNNFQSFPEKPEMEQNYIPTAAPLLRDQWIIKRKISQYRESFLLDALDLEFDPKLKNFSYGFKEEW